MLPNDCRGWCRAEESVGVSQKWDWVSSEVRKKLQEVRLHSAAGHCINTFMVFWSPTVGQEGGNNSRPLLLTLALL